MILKESWYKETSNFDKEWGELLQLAKRGLISNDEFTHRTLRLWGGRAGEGSFLEQDYLGGGYLMTVEWLYHHQGLVEDLMGYVSSMRWFWIEVDVSSQTQVDEALPFNLYHVLQAFEVIGQEVLKDKGKINIPNFPIEKEEDFLPLMNRFVEMGEAIMQKADELELL